jgi:TonB family protein
METVAQPPVSTDEDLNLLTQWGTEDDRQRTRHAAILSGAAHVVLIAVLMLTPRSLTPPRPTHETHQITPLIAPFEVTQKPPNKGKVTKEFDAETLKPRPRIQIPPSRASTTRPAAPRPAAPERKAAPPPANLPEPPKVEEAAKTEAPKIPNPQIAQAPPPPQIQVQEKPKLALENVGPPPTSGTAAGKALAPNATVEDAIRSVARAGTSGGMVVGDIGLGAGGIGEGINLPPAPGKTASNLELKSDPMGVDFRPYLIQVLAAVKRNWFAVMPESVKLGRQGRVGILFSIGRNGFVPKLTVSTYSGTDALDRAAIAGISASQPFPPLPAEFKGDRIILQFNFAYNLPTR